jgi:hypothetical protein
MVPIQTNTFCRGWNGSWIGFEADQDRVKEGDSLDHGPEPFLDGNGFKINERGLNGNQYCVATPHFCGQILHASEY